MYKSSYSQSVVEPSGNCERAKEKERESSHREQELFGCSTKSAGLWCIWCAAHDADHGIVFTVDCPHGSQPSTSTGPFSIPLLPIHPPPISVSPHRKKNATRPPTFFFFFFEGAHMTFILYHLSQ